MVQPYLAVAGCPAFRAALNYRTREADIEAFIVGVQIFGVFADTGKAACP